MAKKTSRIFIRLKCSECGRLNYTTKKSKTNKSEKLVLKKYCPFCKKHTEHVEYPKMK